MKAIVALAQGVEEMEAVITIDCLRRARWEVVAAALAPGVVKASRGVGLVADALWDDVRPDDHGLLALPGGAEGTRRLRAHAGVLEAVRRFASAGKWVAAVCAAPLVLQDAGILAGRRATCHPGVADSFTATARLDLPVVVDGRIITSQGAGTCFDFALAMIEAVDGHAAAARVAEEMVYRR